jgi:thiamine pyrophosphokinase
MAPEAVIIANGDLPSPTRAKGIVGQASKVVCADGGARHALRIGILPDVIIGDLDSLPRAALGRLKRSKVIVSGDQNQTDLEKAIRYLLKQKPKRIVILGATGKRIDQTIANIALLVKYRRKASLRFVDSTGEIEIVQSRTKFRAKVGTTVSLIPASKPVRVTTKGLRYALKNEMLEFGSRGVSNEVIAPIVEIRVRGGTLFLVKLF